MIDRVIDRSIELSQPRSIGLPVGERIEEKFKYLKRRNAKCKLAANSIGVAAFERTFCEIDLPKEPLEPGVIEDIVSYLSKYPSFGEWARDQRDSLLPEDNINIQRIIMLAGGPDSDELSTDVTGVIFI